MELIFWLSVSLLVYVYAGYPLLLVANSAVRRTREVDWPERNEHLPTVTLLISAYNEADCIADKLDNALSLEYPRQLLDIVVISDASSDATDEIVTSYSDQGVRLLRMAARGGKTMGLNAAVAQSTGEVIVFSDANALYRADAVRRLVAPFTDARVGAVIGESSYFEPTNESGRSESLYWRYETWIKALESRNGSVVGGDGAIYAVRRSLYQPMSADALSDFVNPLQVVRSGSRCVYEPRALSYEEAAADFGREYRRKVRIVCRAWRAMWSMRDMLNPMKHGAFALKLWSHKVLRWCVPAICLIAFGSNIALLNEHPFYQVSMAIQIVFYSLAAAGFWMRHRKMQPALFRIPFYFCLVNYAAALGLAHALRGRSYETWTTSRA